MSILSLFWWMVFHYAVWLFTHKVVCVRRVERRASIYTHSQVEVQIDKSHTLLRKDRTQHKFTNDFCSYATCINEVTGPPLPASSPARLRPATPVFRSVIKPFLWGKMISNWLGLPRPTNGCVPAQLCEIHRLGPNEFII